MKLTFPTASIYPPSESFAVSIWGSRPGKADRSDERLVMLSPHRTRYDSWLCLCIRAQRSILLQSEWVYI